MWILREYFIVQKREVNGLNQNDGSGDKQKERDSKAICKVNSTAFDGLEQGSEEDRSIRNDSCISELHSWFCLVLFTEMGNTGLKLDWADVWVCGWVNITALAPTLGLSYFTIHRNIHLVIYPHMDCIA